jgi:cytochrome c-type biogenesis protein CcmH/NrfG
VAQSLYQSALQLRPNNSDALCGYAMLKLHCKDDAAAEAMFKQSLHFDPAHVPTLSR